MFIQKNNLCFTIFSLLCYYFNLCFTEKVTYINVEHPRVTYYNKDYLGYANLTTTRYGRANPVYYVGLSFKTLVTLDENVHVDFYFYEWLTNQYKRSFVEFHFSWCHLIEKDLFFGAAMRQGKLTKPCPHPPDIYDLYNMTINPKFIPPGFPFSRGRIQANFTMARPKVWLADGFVDMKISQMDSKKAKF